MLENLGIEFYQIADVREGKAWNQVRIVGDMFDAEARKRGVLVMVCRTLGEERRELAIEGGEKLAKIEENFWNHDVEGRVDFVKREVEAFGGGDLVLFLVVEREGRRGIVVGGKGEMCVDLIRNGRAARIWSEASGGVVSGWLEDGDELVMGSEMVVEAMGRNLDEGVQKRIDGVRAKVGSGEINHGAVAVVMEVKEVETAVDENELEEELVKPVVVNEPEMKTEVGTEVKKEKIWNKWRGRMGGEKKNVALGEVNDGKGGRKRMTILVGIVFLIILGLSVGVGLNKRSQEIKKEELAAVVEPLTHKLDEAEGLVNLDRTRARKLVSEVKEGVEANKNKFEDERANEIAAIGVRADKLWVEVSGEQEEAGELWMDLEVVRPGLKPEEMAINEGKLYLFDGIAGVVMRVEIEGKSAEVIGGGSELKGIVDGGIAGSEAVVLTEAGIVGVNEETKKTEVLFNRGEENWEEVSKIGGFGGNIYLLDRQDIWKYPKVEEGFGKRRRWLNPGVEPDLSNASDLMIDGDVWVLLSGGVVKRFELGASKSFSLSGVDELKGDKMAGSAEREEIYILNQEAGVIYVFDRESGDYKYQLVWDKLKEAKDLVVDEDNGRLMVVIGSGIWNLNLK